MWVWASRSNSCWHHFLSRGQNKQKICTCRSLQDSSIVVGFSFSFPTKQASIASGTLIEQGKGYANPGAIGSDPVAHLTAAFKRQVRLQWVVRRAVLVVGYALPYCITS